MVSMACREQIEGCCNRILWCLTDHLRTQVTGVTASVQLYTHAHTHVHVDTEKYKNDRKINSWPVTKNNPVPRAFLTYTPIFFLQGTKSAFPSSFAQTQQLLCLNIRDSDNSMSPTEYT